MPVDQKLTRSLRRKAEESLSTVPEKVVPEPEANLQKLVHELSVHQIELEMQNEELRRSQEQLEESRSEYAQLYDSAPVGYLTFDTMGIITRANLTACGFLAITRSLLVNKPFGLFIHPESQEQFRVHRQQVLEVGTTQVCQLVLKREDGTFFDAQLESVAIQLHRLPAINTILTDITEAKRAGRGREQLESRLRQAQKMEALGIMSGGIAHDFNNILAAIIGFSELAAGRVTKGSKDEHYLARVVEAGMRGRELVRQMLAFSRQTKEEKKPLSLGGIVKESIKLIRAATPTTINIRVVDTVNESGRILGDPTQIRQALTNLCTNAAHAMEEKGGTLDIETNDFNLSPSASDHLGIAPGPYVRLVVRDSGVGIAPDIIDRIFDPFFTTRRLGERTGLGLSVVHGIVKHSNGGITVESEPGRGSIFTVYFPMIAGEVESDTAVDAALPTGCERILFVDDEEPLVEMGEAILAELGYDVTSRPNGREALALFRMDPSRFDLVVTDQTMPEMTGIELAKEILAIRADMPIIMCTGFSYLVDADAARAAGIKAFATKPLTKREIAKTIRNVLKG